MFVPVKEILSNGLIWFGLVWFQSIKNSNPPRCGGYVFMLNNLSLGSGNSTTLSLDLIRHKM